MSLMFMSYRRKDTAAIARRVYDVLEKEFGHGSVFMDIDTIAGGEDFQVRLEASLQQCHVLLALIGPRWMEDERLHNPDDFVRLEIERALSRELPVVPLLIDGANMPRVGDLPSSIAPLTQQHALPIESGQSFPGQMDRLVRDLKRLLGTRVSSGEPLLHAEMVRLQSIINDDVADLCFILAPKAGTSFDDFGFRISTAKHGSFFCFTSQRNLIIADRVGNIIRSLPAMGSGLEDGHAFYSIDLQVGKKAIPQHALVHLSLGDLETASLDFMVKPSALPRSDMCYAVTVTAVVSNWFVACGSFSLKNPVRDISLPVFKEFVSASPFAEDFELRVLSRHHAAPAGEDLESHDLDTMLATIQAYAGRSQRIMQVVRLPSSTAQSYRVPVSYHFLIEFNRMIAHYGYGEMGEAKVLVHKAALGHSPRNTFLANLLRKGTSSGAGSGTDGGAPQATRITALFLMESLRHTLVDETSQTPPQQLQALVGWMLSYWTFLDRQDRAQYTEFPLARVVVLCPVDHGTWLWHLEGRRLFSDWESKWTAMESAQLAVSTMGVQTLQRYTAEWRLIPDARPK
jgi:TIR domain-containing protein